MNGYFVEERAKFSRFASTVKLAQKALNFLYSSEKVSVVKNVDMPNFHTFLATPH